MQNEQDLEKLVHAHTAALLRYCTGLLGCEADAQDAVQKTFIKAWQQRHTLRHDGTDNERAWLYRIAFNECLNFLNKQRAENQLSIDDADAALINKLESDPYFNGDETQRLFQKAILQLPEKQRIIFNLKYFQEMKYEDMSEILGTSVGALKASYHHAVKKIEDFFHQHD